MDVFRQEFAPVAPEVLEYISTIKQKAQELYDLMDRPVNSDGQENRTDPRCIATAKTHLETSVMWAVKGLTA